MDQGLEPGALDVIGGGPQGGGNPKSVEDGDSRGPTAARSLGMGFGPCAARGGRGVFGVLTEWFW